MNSRPEILTVWYISIISVNNRPFPFFPNTTVHRTICSFTASDVTTLQLVLVPLLLLISSSSDILVIEIILVIVIVSFCLIILVISIIFVIVLVSFCQIILVII